MFKLDKKNMAIIQMIVVVEVIVLCIIGGMMQSSNRITITDDDLIQSMEPVKLEMRVLPIPETKKVPEKREVEPTKPKKKKHPVYPISNRIIKALCLKESGNNPDAPPGDDGKALGILQIHPDTVKDIERWFGIKYTHKDMKDPVKAKHVCRLWLGRHAAKNKELYNIEPTDEMICRMWNGGRKGWMKTDMRVFDNTQEYWDSIKSNNWL